MLYLFIIAAGFEFPDVNHIFDTSKGILTVISLVAFIASLIAVCYLYYNFNERQKLKSNPNEYVAISEKLKLDLNLIPEGQRAKLTMRTLQNRITSQKIAAITLVCIAIVVGVVVVSIKDTSYQPNDGKKTSDTPGRPRVSYISGKVSNQGRGLAGAVLRLGSNGGKIVTDDAGNYKLRLDTNVDLDAKLYCSYFGFVADTMLTLDSARQSSTCNFSVPDSFMKGTLSLTGGLLNDRTESAIENALAPYLATHPGKLTLKFSYDAGKYKSDGDNVFEYYDHGVVSVQVNSQCSHSFSNNIGPISLGSAADVNRQLRDRVNQIVLQNLSILCREYVYCH